ncbi:MAG: ABC transporter permease subunit, partial [Anaerolineae bacterium]
MLRNVFLKSLRDQGKALLWWSIGIGGYVLFMMAFYPTIQASAELMKSYLDALPEAFLAAFMGEFTDLGSPAGFLSAYLFSMIAPLLFLIYSVGVGSDAIAGEEDRGTLDLLLANPVSRSKVLLQKFATIAAATTVLAVVYWVTMVAGAAMVSMDVSYLGLLAVTVSTILLALCLGALSLAVGAASGNKGLGT